MSLLNWILGKKTANVSNDSNHVAQELFVDTTPPATEIENEDIHRTASGKRETRRIQRPSAVHDFLVRDFWQQGYGHAVQFPSKDRKQSALIRLRTDYRQVLHQADQSLVSEKESHEQEVLRMTGISEVLDAQLLRRSREIDSIIKQISHQLELSVDDEGWLAPVLAAYNDGFLVGSMEYMRANDLLGGITGLH